LTRRGKAKYQPGKKRKKNTLRRPAKGIIGARRPRTRVLGKSRNGRRR